MFWIKVISSSLGPLQKMLRQYLILGHPRIIPRTFLLLIANNSVTGGQVT